jgi:predicted  nucleic acid-binding Zn-ribbon protein
MTENVENLVLEHLRALRAGQERMERKLDEHTQRLGRLEMAIAGLRRDMVHTDEAAAEQSVRIDHLAERLDRIERRLELRD